MKLLTALFIAFALSFTFTSCENPANGNGNGASEHSMPAAFQNTSWVHGTSGDRVDFGTTTVTVIPASGSQQTFTLLNSETLAALARTTLFFGNSPTSDFITIQGNAVWSVGLGGVQLTNNWTQYGGSRGDFLRQLMLG